MDGQTIAIIIAIAGGWATIIAVFMPPLIMIIRRVDHLTQVVTALANHHHDPQGRPSFTLPSAAGDD